MAEVQTSRQSGLTAEFRHLGPCLENAVWLHLMDLSSICGTMEESYVIRKNIDDAQLFLFVLSAVLNCKHHNNKQTASYG